MSIINVVKIQKISVADSDMKYTDQFFAFPIHMYLTEDVQKGNELEELGIKGVHEEPEGVIGLVKCLPEDIVTWWDSFSKPRSLDDVESKGFDMTHIQLRNGEEFSCLWSRKKFEATLNSFMDKLHKKIEEEASANIEATFNKVIEDIKSKQPKKEPWYKRIFKK